MLEFIIGRAGTGKTHYCLEAVKQKLHKSPQGKPLVILVPDHMTFAVERQLALELKDLGGFVRAYVLGMSRLAYQVLMRCGGALQPHLNEIGKQLLLSRVLSSSELSILAKAARQRHFTSSVSNIIEEFKTAGISVETLRDLLKIIENDSLKQKLADLTTIYQGLNEQMEGQYHDSEDIMNLAIRRLPKCEWLRHAEIWIDGFDAFNPQHLQVVEQLMQLADDIHLTLCLNNLDLVEHEAQTALFHRQYIVYQQISMIAKKLKIKQQVNILIDNHRYEKQSLSFIEQQLFKFPLTEAEYTGGLHIVEAANRRLECEAVASDILRLCREGNYRHQDIGILLRSEDDYGDLLQAVLNDYAIPYFSDSKRKSAHHPLAELMRSTLEALRTWQYEPLFRAFKTDFFVVSREDVDYLENYVLSFGIRGRMRWLQQEDWSFTRNKHIDEDDAVVIDEAEKASLLLINDIRRQLMLPLEQFYNSVQKAQTVEDFTKSLYDFLTKLNVPQILDEWRQQAENSGDMALSKEHQQIWNSIMDLFDQLVQTCGSDEIDLKSYEQLINDGLDSIQISLIPPGCDYVMIAPFEHNTLNNKRAVYILGANEKIMPRHVKNEGLLSDAERLLMASMGINISGGVLEDNFMERYLLYKGFSLAREYLWVSYALADSEGMGLNKSILISRLRQILPNAEFTSIPLETIYQEKSLQVTTKRRSLSNFIAAVRKFRELNELEPFWQDVYNHLLHDDVPLDTAIQGIFAAAPREYLPASLAAKIYTKRKILRGSVTRFEQFFNCPFKHFAHYALNLQERNEFNFAAPDLGILLHAVMHRFGDVLTQQNRSWQSVSPDECADICEDIIKTLAPKLQNQILLSSNRYKHLLERIKQLAVGSLNRLIEFSKHSQFAPRALEQNFGADMNDNTMPPLLFDDDNGHKIEITGQIDRIDITDNYYLVIDYKSGNAFINLLEVYYGLKLQLMTYLLVAKNAAMLLCDMPEALPAGILYCFLKSPTLTSKRKLSLAEIKTQIEKQMRMPGWVLAEPEVIRKIDDSLNFIKINLNKKDGSISAVSRSYVKTAEEFDLLMEHIEATLKDAGKRILQGEMRIFPYRYKDEVACKFCPYIAICRFDKNVSGYEYNEIAPLEDNEIMEKMRLAADVKKGDLPCLGQNSKKKP